MISTQNLCKSYDGNPVLRGVSLTVQRGECLGIVGENGAGKSVLCRLLSGLEPFDEGNLAIEAIDFDAETDPHDPQWVAARRIVGFVPKPSALQTYRTAEELIIEGPLFVLNNSKKEALATVAPWLTRLGLSAHQQKYPGQLSSGQLARVALARALSLGARYLICDEVTANMDAHYVSEVAKAIQELNADGIGVVCVSHDMQFIAKIATRIVTLRDGCLHTCDASYFSTL